MGRKGHGRNDSSDAADSNGQMEESEVMDFDEGLPMVSGEILKEKMVGKLNYKYYSSFDMGNIRFELGDSVLMESEEKLKKPYVGYIKEIWQAAEQQVMLQVQWLYRPEESKLKNSKHYPVDDPRTLLYSFHFDDVAADSVLHKCIVRLIPPTKQLPDPVLHPGFVVQFVYDIVNRKIFPVTDKDFDSEHQQEIDRKISQCRALWAELPDKEERKVPSNPLPGKPFIPRSRRTERKLLIPDTESEEEKGGDSDVEVVEAPGNKIERILVEAGAKTGVHGRDLWRQKLLEGVQAFCEENADLWPKRAVQTLSALEGEAHQSLGSDPRKYNFKLRSLFLNIKGNKALAMGILTGKLNPAEVLVFGPEELKAGGKVARVSKPDSLEQEIQRLSIGCENCSEKQVNVLRIMNIGLTSKYEVCCDNCGHTWFVGQDSIASMSEPTALTSLQRPTPLKENTSARENDMEQMQ